MTRLRRVRLVALALSLSLLMLFTSSALATNGGLAHFDNSVYELVETPLDWESAKAAASTRVAPGCEGAHLATITSPGEQAVLASLMTSTGRAWLGGFQPPDELSLAQGWQWITGEPWVDTNWAAGEPNDNPAGNYVPGSEQHLVTLPGVDMGAWNDAPGIEDKFFVVESEDCVERLAGSNRFATAAAISASEFDPGVPAAYVATGGNFPDALAGGPVAALNGSPILLLGSIPGETAAELTRLQPQKIVILGGTGVVSAVDAAALAAFTTGPVERLSGANRFATAAAISVAEFSPGVPVAYIATGANFPDALAGGPLAAINGGPILLVDADSIPIETAAELVRLQPQKIVILGGTGVVSDTVKTQLGFFTAGAVDRLSGTNRFATAAAISSSQFNPGVDVAYIATGANFPDALAGGPVAGTNGGPILLVNQNSIPGATAAELTRLAPKKIVILGGTGVVSPAVATQLASFIS